MTNLEEQIEEEKEYLRYKQEIYNRLSLIEKDELITKLELLKIGSVPYQIENMEFLVVKVNETYFDFIKERDGFYYKW